MRKFSKKKKKRKQVRETMKKNMGWKFFGEVVEEKKNVNFF
jgi:hypothetical protein